MISVMVPALNEELFLESTVKDIHSAAKATDVSVDIVIVDDGSKDHTPEIADRLARENDDVRVIHNEHNMGLGASVRKVLALEGLHDKFVIIAGDNDMPLALIKDMFAAAPSADLVFAYFVNREARGRRRNVISQIYQAINMISYNIFVMYISGPCIYPTALIQTFRIRSQRFSVPVELTVKSLRSGCTFVEVAGFMQTGEKGSSALSWKNLWEVIVKYFQIFWEVHVSEKERFSKSPRRVA